MKRVARFVAMAAVAVACVSGAEAVDMQTVIVDNPGNDGEWSGGGYGGYGPDRICGAVDYVYNIGTYEVTAGQYRDFLNTVDPAGSNPYGLYNSSMDSDSYGCQITWNAGSSIYDFSGGTVESPGSTAADWADRPVNFVSWGDAARFANWLHNGQPTGQLTEDPAQDAGLTEDGSYFLDGATSDAELMAVVREADATWVIPSEDEWYKAAYYDGGSDVFYNYPTISDSAPSNLLGNPTDPGNNATFFLTGGFTIGSPYYRTEVGAHENSDSPYATFDQGGNVWEWNEAILYGSYRGRRGGSFYEIGRNYGPLHAAYRGSCYSPPYEYYGGVGFRVAEVSEQAAVPAVSEWGMVAMALLVLTAGTLVWARRSTAIA